jgi:hypothetical protein
MLLTIFNCELPSITTCHIFVKNHKSIKDGIWSQYPLLGYQWLLHKMENRHNARNEKRNQNINLHGISFSPRNIIQQDHTLPRAAENTNII